MKKITSFQDVEFIINNKLNVKDFVGHNIHFVNFLGLSLLEIVKIINSRDWTYDPEF